MIKSEKRAIKHITGTQKNKAYSGHEKHIPLRMYLDALKFWRNERKLTSFQVEIAHEIECVCEAHHGGPCMHVRLAEMDKIKGFENSYNQIIDIPEIPKYKDSVPIGYFTLRSLGFTPKSKYYTDGKIIISNDFKLNGQQLKTVGDLRKFAVI
jgi:hypothetical protein